MENIPHPMAWLTRRDGSVLLGHGPFQPATSAPAEGVAFYVQDFSMGDPAPWKIPIRIERLSPAEFASRFPTLPDLECDWLPLDAAPFSVVFQEVMSSIQSGIFEKTVPVVTETGVAGPNPAPAIVGAMARRPPPLQSYGWVRNGSGFAGASPELLFSLDGASLETMALAGTARSEDRDVFAVDQKEIREHEYVAQTLVSKLMDLGQLQRESRQILELGPIVHFLTRIRVILESPMSAEDLVRRLHPTPAVGPLPRTEGTIARLMDWRKRLDCPSRFGAPFGLWDQGRFEAIVAIRGVWWEDSRLSIPAGCGIIEASRLVNEWRELRLKREAVKRFLDQP
jgi:menaquinone-specific isochorismate synthase